MRPAAGVPSPVPCLLTHILLFIPVLLKGAACVTIPHNMSDIFESDIEKKEEADDLNVLEEHEKEDSRNRKRKTSSIPEGAYKFRLNYSNEFFYAVSPKDMTLNKGDNIIAETKFGADIAECIGRVEKEKTSGGADVYAVIRKATEDDLARAEHLKEKEAEAFEKFKTRIAEYKLDMKAEAVHFVVGEGKAIFFFTSEQRVDFRELVKSLVSDFHMRIELRQISGREVCRMKGGIGLCGRTFCCSFFSDRTDSISIRSIKDQDLSLNTSKITGCCGRILCCLAYEANWYREERRRFPRRGIELKYDDKSFRVKGVNLVEGKVTLRDEGGSFSEVSVESLCQRNGVWQMLELRSEEDASE